MLPKTRTFYTSNTFMDFTDRYDFCLITLHLLSDIMFKNVNGTNWYMWNQHANII